MTRAAGPISVIDIRLLCRDSHKGSEGKRIFAGERAS